MLRSLAGRAFPAAFVFVGYLICLGLFVMLCMLSLFVTAALTEAEADEWLRRSGVSILLKVFVITPVVSIGKVVLRRIHDLENLDVGDIYDG